MTNCKLRPATAEDRARLLRDIAADPDHRITSTAEFFYQPEPGAECIAFEDNEGTVFYVRIERALRVHIQFAPADCVTRQRTRATLQSGFAWLIETARQAGFRQLLFDSTSEALMRFCEKRFAFRRSRNEVVRDITPPGA